MRRRDKLRLRWRDKNKPQPPHIASAASTPSDASPASLPASTGPPPSSSPSPSLSSSEVAPWQASHLPARPLFPVMILVKNPFSSEPSSSRSVYVSLSSDLRLVTVKPNNPSPRYLLDFRCPDIRLTIDRLPNLSTPDSTPPLSLESAVEPRVRAAVHTDGPAVFFSDASKQAILLVAATSEERDAFLSALRLRVAPWPLLRARMTDEMVAARTQAPSMSSLADAACQFFAGSTSESVADKEARTAGVARRVWEMAGTVAETSLWTATFTQDIAGVAKNAEKVERLAKPLEGLAIVGSAFSLVALSARAVSLIALENEGRGELVQAEEDLREASVLLVGWLFSILGSGFQDEDGLVDRVFGVLEECWQLAKELEGYLLLRWAARAWSAEDVHIISSKVSTLTGKLFGVGLLKVVGRVYDQVQELEWRFNVLEVECVLDESRRKLPTQFQSLARYFAGGDDGAGVNASGSPDGQEMERGTERGRRALPTVASHSAALARMTDDISKVTQFNQLRCRATLMHPVSSTEAQGADMFHASNIVSSIEFDRDSELVATAGVAKLIKVFGFSNIMRNLADVHYPVKEIQANAKLSSLAWNPCFRHHLVSSDYEGVVSLWDAQQGVAIVDYEEHEKRAWSVDFCGSNPDLLASGADDGRVKLWSTNEPDSVQTIDIRANVCSVKFNPVRGEMLAIGSAHHHVHYYDLRNTCAPVQIFKSHKKTVSYVKFLSEHEMVSACADNSIKLWNLNTMELERTFTGHSNGRRFVGLSVTSDIIACGSETNSIYAYYKALTSPVVKYCFAGQDPPTRKNVAQEEDDELFVSSVCWCPRHPSLLVAANSLGSIKLLSLKTHCAIEVISLKRLLVSNVSWSPRHSYTLVAANSLDVIEVLALNDSNLVAVVAAATAIDVGKTSSCAERSSS